MAITGFIKRIEKANIFSVGQIRIQSTAFPSIEFPLNFYLLSDSVTGKKQTVG